MNSKPPVENGEHAMRIIEQLYDVVSKPIIPAAVLLNEMLPVQQAVIVWFIKRCKERRGEK